MVEPERAKRSEKQSPAIRFAVEIAMAELIDRLVANGHNRAEVALLLADASEDYVIRLAGSRSEFSHS